MQAPKPRTPQNDGPMDDEKALLQELETLGLTNPAMFQAMMLHTLMRLADAVEDIADGGVEDAEVN